jgi:hypothetical protein
MNGGTPRIAADLLDGEVARSDERRVLRRDRELLDLEAAGEDQRDPRVRAAGVAREVAFAQDLELLRVELLRRLERDVVRAALAEESREYSSAARLVPIASRAA